LVFISYLILTRVCHKRLDNSYREWSHIAFMNHVEEFH